MNERPLVIAKVLHWFEKNLSMNIFHQAHRTHIINKMCVADTGVQSALILINGDVVKVSRRKQTACKNLLKSWA
jgi:DNA-binding LytR/AlgR family response regulator